jgi:hypothetical protein
MTPPAFAALRAFRRAFTSCCSAPGFELLGNLAQAAVLLFCRALGRFNGVTPEHGLAAAAFAGLIFLPIAGAFQLGDHVCLLDLGHGTQHLTV